MALNELKLTSDEFLAGLGTGALAVLILLGCFKLVRYCCCYRSSIEEEDKIEIVLEENTTDIAINGTFFSIEKTQNKIVLVPNPPVELPLSNTQRIAKSITEKRHQYFSRQGPRFSAFYSGNTSTDDITSINGQLFAKTDAGVNSDNPETPDGTPRDSQSSALSKYLKQGIEIIDKQKKNGVSVNANSGVTPTKMVEVGNVTKTADLELGAPPPIKGRGSNLLRASPEGMEEGITKNNPPAIQKKGSNLLRQSPMSNRSHSDPEINESVKSQEKSGQLLQEFSDEVRHKKKKLDLGRDTPDV